MHNPEFVTREEWLVISSESIEERKRQIRQQLNYVRVLRSMRVLKRKVGQPMRETTRQERASCFETLQYLRAQIVALKKSQLTYRLS